MNDTQRSHDRHDRFLIAALAADDLSGQALSDAHDLVENCPECAELLADLRAIARATAALPQILRTLDFQLSPETADRLGARGWRGILVRIADSRFGAARPIAVGLTSLGLVAAIAGAIPGGIGGYGSGGAPAQPNAGYAVTSSDSGSRSAAGGGGAEAVSSPQPPRPVAAGGLPSPSPVSFVPFAASPAASAAASAAPASAAASANLDTVSSPPAFGQAYGPASPAAASAGPPARETTKSGNGGAEGLVETSAPSGLLVLGALLLAFGLGILGAQWAAARLASGRSR
jgi:hypothetical protein